MTHGVSTPTDAADALTADGALAVVTDVLAVVCGVEVQSLSSTTELSAIRADSLARVEMAEQLEERLAVHLPGLHIPDDALAAFGSVGDICSYLVTRP